MLDHKNVLARHRIVRFQWFRNHDSLNFALVQIQRSNGRELLPQGLRPPATGIMASHSMAATGITGKNPAGITCESQPGLRAKIREAFRELFFFAVFLILHGRGRKSTVSGNSSGNSFAKLREIGRGMRQEYFLVVRIFFGNNKNMFLYRLLVTRIWCRQIHPRGSRVLEENWMAQSICHIGPTQAIVSSETRASRPIPPSHPLPTQTPRPESKPSLQAPKPQLPKCQHLMNSIDIAACANILIFSTSALYAVIEYLKKLPSTHQKSWHIHSNKKSC